MQTQGQARRRQRGNGDGSLYRRRDGYWAGAFYAPTVSGKRRRIVVYGKTREQARDKLVKAQRDAREGMLVPDEVWKLGPYLEYWLENFVKRNRRPATYTLYEMNWISRLVRAGVPLWREPLFRCPVSQRAGAG
jgi:hypothetical protein